MIRVDGSSVQQDYEARFRFLIAVVMALFIVLGIRSWYLQIFQGKKFKQFSDENRIELKKAPAMRGRILDRTGKVIADSRASFDLTVTREDLAAPHENVTQKLEETLSRLGTILSWKDADIAKAKSKFRGFHPSEPVSVKNDLSRDELAQIMVRQHTFPGVDIVPIPARAYPFSEHGSHVLGYLGEIDKPQFEKIKTKPDNIYELGDVWGISGVERAFDVVVRGENGIQPFVEDAKGRQVDIAESSELIPAYQRRDPVRGKDLVLAIDSRVQEAAEEAFTYDSGAVVAIDPNNGDVLALLSKPEYSPERFVRGVSADYWNELHDDPLNPLYDRALRGLYPPGSTFKFVTAIAALSEKVTTPEEKVFCAGSYRLGREVKSCWKKEGHGYMNIHEAIKQSCDVYFYEMGRRLGIERIAKYAKGFGMGQKTDIGINNEVKGLVPTEAWKLSVYKQPWVGGETLSVAIGQGALQITPIQMAVALSSLLNGGKLLRPRIALRTQNGDGTDAKPFPVEERGRVDLDPKNIAAVKDGLVAVVNEPGGTAYSIRSQTIMIGGKTGTAQTVGKHAAKQLGDHAWFIAFAPADQPKIVIAIIAEYAGHGGVAAAPIAKKMIEAYLGENS